MPGIGQTRLSLLLRLSFFLWPYQKVEKASVANKIAAYKPVNCLKPVDQNIWIVDGPIIRFKNIPFSTRMTIIRLSSGELFVHSPTTLTAELKAEVESPGPVRHLISPNKIHKYQSNGVAELRRAFRWIKGFKA